MDAHSPRVLVCDDCAPIRAMVAEVLEDSGFTVAAHAGDGAQAIEQMTFTRADAIVMDLQMPVMDGFEAIRRIRRRWPDTAIVAHSSFEADDVAWIARAAGADAYVEKGCPDELPPAVSSALEQRATTPAPAA